MTEVPPSSTAARCTSSSGSPESWATAATWSWTARRGEAALVDPLCDVDRYVDAARTHGWQLSTTLDTHVHNDFISGGPNLRALTGSVFAVPDGSGITGADRLLRDGDEVRVGSLRLRAIHSPGHTPEHLSYLLLGAGGDELALFSGGALMVGTMARPDLLGPSWTYALSRMGRETLQRRLLTLPAELTVLPTHGGGSFCGSASSDVRLTTIGAEARDNPLAAAPDLAHFLALHAKQGRYPAYYARMAPRNRSAEPVQAAIDVAQLSPEEFAARVAGGAVAVDCRAQEDFDTRARARLAERPVRRALLRLGRLGGGHRRAGGARRGVGLGGGRRRPPARAHRVRGPARLARCARVGSRRPAHSQRHPVHHG